MFASQEALGASPSSSAAERGAVAELHLMGITDAEALPFAPALGASGWGESMAADSRILAAALACRPLARQRRETAAAQDRLNATGTEGPLPKEDEVYLATSDKNLAVLARLHGVPSGGMAQVRADLSEREATLRRAYAGEALAQAACMAGR